MKKFTRLLALFLVMAMSFVLVLPLASCGDENNGCTECIDADKNGKCDNCGKEVAVAPPPVNQNVNYTITVKAISGEALRDAMVFIYDSSNDAFFKYARTDSNGAVSFDIPYSSTYYVQIDNVSSEYVIRDRYDFQPGKTSMNITLATTLLPEANLDGEQFNAGDAMRDFTLTDIDGNVIKLRDVFEKKKAIVINFWYVGCSWCIKEFPYVQEAYESTYTAPDGTERAYKDDIEVIAVNMLASDTLESIKSLRETMGLTFPIAKDNIGLFTAFGFSGTPSTVIIDRYGMIALAEEGAIIGTRYWTNGFDYFIDEGYKRGVIESIKAVSPMLKPDVEMSPVEEIAGAFESDTDITVEYRPETEGNNVEYIWPFITATKGDKTVIKPSNYDIDNSTAIIYADVTLRAGEAVLFDYFSSTHYDVNNGSADILYVIVDGKDMYSIGGLSDIWVTETDDGWRTCCPYVALEDGTYSIAFCYVKDMADKAGDDTVYLDNLRIVDKSQIDVETYIYRYAANEPNEYQTGFNSYVDVVLGDDGYYHVGTKDGPILLANLIGYTRFENNNFVSNRLYSEAEFIVNGVDKFNSLELYCNYASNSTIYGYCSVTAELKDLLVAYVEKYRSEIGYSADENLWLSLCSYHDAYGTDGKQMEDPIKGLASFSAYEAVESPTEKDENGKYVITEEKLNNVKYERVIMPRGYFYKFTPTKSGVYRVLSKLENDGASGELNGIIGWIFTGSHEEWSLHANGERTLYSDSEQGERFVPELLVDSNDDGILERDMLNCTMVSYMEAGKDYYIALAFYDVYYYGEFDFTLHYVGETYNMFKEASPGPFTFELGAPDENGDYTMADTIAGGIDVALGEDGYYYHKIGVDAQGNDILGSKVYADFIWTTNIFTTRTMQQLIKAHSFDFSKTAEDLIVISTYNSYAKKGFADEWTAEFEAKWTDEILVSLASQIEKWNKDFEDEWDEKGLADVYGEDKKDEYVDERVNAKISAAKKEYRAAFDDDKWNSIPELQQIADGMYTATYYNSELADKYEQYGLAGLRKYWGADYEAEWKNYQVEDVLAGDFHGRGVNYTLEMQAIYDANIKYTDDSQTNIEFDPEHPEMQGCVAVNERLGELLQMLMDKYTFPGVDHSWTKLCYYYQYLGSKA